ncbi:MULTISPECIES: hypothetical protein [Enterobacterales]|jgi:hypothetical protein|uniref:Uncharacterized protein n=5 Tax=Morganellaceae TaxID=1903414 RepID=A0A899NE45_PROST|nr:MULTISPECIES: hypothetical protein [Enterobacterales]EKH6496423.1 hypothetical protein [Providencia rettgeri]ELB1110366.1 hypothetical protein [Morganella morganii]ELL8907372.1 hypothetical protein [Proteus mirabilis]ELQ1457948.1 hypothetical protein [Providencia rettgeri]ELR5042652.1 hypothetical protein [Providencia rettgeri]
MSIVNLTAYKASDAQREMGVIDVERDISQIIREKLSFNDCPTVSLMQQRADELADIALLLCSRHQAEGVLVYAKTYFMPTLITALSERGITAFATYAPKSIVCEQGQMSSRYTHSNLVCCSPAA